MSATLFKTIIVAIFALLGVMVFFQNRQAVSLSFLYWNMEVSVLILTPVLLSLGFTGGWLASRIPMRASNQS
jgi:uncharacterized membrane protein YciS (DUF1049 family)